MQISINIVASPALSDLIDDNVGRIVASVDRLAQAIEKLAAGQALAQSTSQAPAPITVEPETRAQIAPPAPPETKAEPSPVPAQKPSSKPYVPIVKWSPERCQLAVDLRAEGKLPAAIFLEVNKLPGEPIASADSVGVKLVELKKKGMRPTAKAAQAPPASPTSPALPPAAAPPPSQRPALPLPAGLYDAGEIVPLHPIEARTWLRKVLGAAALDVSDADLLEEVNRHRALHFLPKIRLIPSHESSRRFEAIMTHEALA